MYDETTAKRGSDDVYSMLYHFFINSVPDHVVHLDLFCNGCERQNKNWTVKRFLKLHVACAEKVSEHNNAFFSAWTFVPGV